jgi:phosphatidylethanolamine/phosphatidyl-N-methylethanolamine N-methyltransferase
MSRSNAAPVAVLASEIYGNADNSALGLGYAGLLGDQALFFRTWLRQPAIIGAIMPTRPLLARAMARAAVGSGPIVELGGGTGPITRALVEFGAMPRHLTVIERHPIFHRLLTDRFPRLRVLCGDAEELGNILAPAEMGRVGVVVSSLPRLGWPLARQRSILEQCFTALRAEGVFLEFSYGPLSPIPTRLVKELGLAPRRLQQVWGNLPPATIWEYRRADTLRSRKAGAKVSENSIMSQQLSARPGPPNQRAPGTTSFTLVP